MERYAIYYTWVNRNGEEREEYEDNSGKGYPYEDAVQFKNNLARSSMVRIKDIELILM